MDDRGTPVWRLAGGPLHTRTRKRWVIAAAVPGIWLFFLIVSGSAGGSSLLLVVLAVLAVACVMVLRCLGIGRDHPLIRPLATRPWRDGREVLHLALRHLPEVFVITPNGSRLAPSAIEMCMNPADVDSLASVIDLSVVNAHAAEAYQAEIAACSAWVAQGAPVEVSVVAEPEVPAGRYRFRQRKQRGAQIPADGPAARRPSGVHFHDGLTRADPAEAETVLAAAATASDLPRRPLLRLVTGESVTETRLSGARAGRGRAAELMLPDEPTLSRAHARFTYVAGEWRMTCMGRNGALLNGTPLTGEEVIRDGDSIRWGRHDEALISRVEIR